MIGYILLGGLHNWDHTPPTIFFLIVFCAIIRYFFAKLILMLLPDHKKVCPACNLLVMILETD
jgi:hypothetical protein